MAAALVNALVDTLSSPFVSGVAPKSLCTHFEAKYAKGGGRIVPAAAGLLRFQRIYRL